ncbi:GntR family transcriptional regulator [Rhodoligotrophos defluvii]|uniref:GntR family transcriptional regulator n=1 Tax=Rhodoligotrophos defluvii TaxID=2561934 RepID=UPI0010C9F2BC|nr:GntR family transcriptional regulator [Rhodoligotrophos defluvii]
MSARIREELARLDLRQPERVTLNDRVYSELRRLIISGRLRPGQSISIRALANVINVSPMPVRSALQRLVTEGALDVQPNRAFALPVLTPEDFREIADVRATVEGFAAERAVPNLGEEDVAFLREINRQMFEAGNAGQENYLELNRQFHFHIYNASKMPRLLRFIETLWLQIGPLLNLVAAREDIPIGLQAHHAMVAAVAAKDAAAARAAVERDILDAAKVIVAGLGRGDFATR